MNLLLLREEDRLNGEGFYQLEGRRAEHIYCVLHAREGDTLKAAIPGGKIGLAQVVSSSRKQAVVCCKEFNQEPPEKNRIVPIISLPRPQSFKKTLHFIASGGIRKAFFIGSAKVEKSYWKSSSLDPEAIEEELLLGMEQGVDPIKPQLHFYPKIWDFFEQEHSFLESCERRIIAHPYETAQNCPHALKLAGPLALAVGPEGGYTPDEVQTFRNKGFECITLGSHILRVEFALSVLCGKLIP
ncbi:MAG: RsmE family RNA methyltransferase [Lentisphaeria bacterium]|nr:RsmE family RNA methyltransferase [Lentisphaeria bacterium]